MAVPARSARKGQQYVRPMIAMGTRCVLPAGCAASLEVKETVPKGNPHAASVLGDDVIIVRDGKMCRRLQSRDIRL